MWDGKACRGTKFSTENKKKFFDKNYFGYLDMHQLSYKVFILWIVSILKRLFIQPYPLASLSNSHDKNVWSKKKFHTPLQILCVCA